MLRRITLFFVVSLSLIYAASNDANATDTNATDSNKTAPSQKQKSSDSAQKKIQRQIEKEKKYAQEQKFYQADEYDFKGAEVDPDTLKKVKPIEPDYDFDITDVYRDDI